MRDLNGRRDAFTLIELLIVVAIIAILALIAVPNFLEAQTRAKVAREKASLRMIALAVEAYYADNNAYPPMTDRSGRYAYPCSTRFTWITTPIAYLTSVPQDPFISDATDYDKRLLPLDTDESWDTYAYASCDGSYENDWWVFSHWWRCVGVGPARVRRWRGDLPVGFPGPPASTFRFPDYIYDPTNGTVSWGFVWRIGPRSPTTFRGYHPIETL